VIPHITLRIKEPFHCIIFPRQKFEALYDKTRRVALPN
jgi:hypothetical protein